MLYRKLLKKMVLHRGIEYYIGEFSKGTHSIFVKSTKETHCGHSFTNPTFLKFYTSFANSTEKICPICQANEAAKIGKRTETFSKIALSLYCAKACEQIGQPDPKKFKAEKGPSEKEVPEEEISEKNVDPVIWDQLTPDATFMIVQYLTPGEVLKMVTFTKEILKWFEGDSLTAMLLGEHIMKRYIRDLEILFEIMFHGMKFYTRYELSLNNASGIPQEAFAELENSRNLDEFYRDFLRFMLKFNITWNHMSKLKSKKLDDMYTYIIQEFVWRFWQMRFADQYHLTSEYLLNANFPMNMDVLLSMSFKNASVLLRNLSNITSGMDTPYYDAEGNFDPIVVIDEKYTKDDFFVDFVSRLAGDALKSYFLVCKPPNVYDLMHTEYTKGIGFFIYSMTESGNFEDIIDLYEYWNVKNMEEDLPFIGLSGMYRGFNIKLSISNNEYDFVKIILENYPKSPSYFKNAQEFAFEILDYYAEENDKEVFRFDWEPFIIKNFKYGPNFYEKVYRRFFDDPSVTQQFYFIYRALEAFVYELYSNPNDRLLEIFKKYLEIYTSTDQKKLIKKFYDEMFSNIKQKVEKENPSKMSPEQLKTAELMDEYFWFNLNK